MPNYRSIKSCSIVFGMLSIPVKVYTATEDKDISFNQLHASCGSRILYRKWCNGENCEVPPDQIQRAYAWAKDRYIPITDEELDALPVASKQTIDLGGFVGSGEVDPSYVEKTYWLEPETVGLKPYVLLRRAMLSKGVMGVAKVTLRTKERICLLRATENLILMETLYWPDEVRLSLVPPVPDVIISGPEMEMANLIIDAGRMVFTPEIYIDEYRVALLGLIENKKAGLPADQAPRQLPAPTTDLMAALRASLDQIRAEHEEVSSAPPTTKRPRRKKSTDGS